MKALNEDARYIQDIISASCGPCFVSTRNTFDAGWETMVFPMVKNMPDYRNPLSGYTKRYDSEKEACAGHVDTIIRLCGKEL